MEPAPKWWAREIEDAIDEDAARIVRGNNRLDSGDGRVRISKQGSGDDKKVSIEARGKHTGRQEQEGE